LLTAPFPVKKSGIENEFFMFSAFSGRYRPAKKGHASIFSREKEEILYRLTCKQHVFFRKVF